MIRLLPHHRYVCSRHSYWIGLLDAGQAATPLGRTVADIVRAQRRHLRLVLHRRHIGPVLIRDWSRPVDGITATIWASQTTHPIEDCNGATATTPPGTG